MEFYQKNKVIFLTGATGFVGKTLLEKILRSLPSVKKIYVLVRVSKKKSLQSRIDTDIFGSRIFETLRSQYGDEKEFQEKVVSKVCPIQGDITLENLGMSDHDIKTVQEDTNIIFSCAASVSFTLPLKKAKNININGPLRLMNLAEGMPHLEAFVHVSTAYVNSAIHIDDIKEEVYPYPLGDPQEFLNKIDSMNDEEIAAYEKNVVLKVFPNTYTATKAAVEHFLQRWRDTEGYPAVIARPTMVAGSIAEPVPGWIEGMGAANKTVALCGTGDFKLFIGDRDLPFDLVPVDIVCKILLMSATQARTTKEVPVIHIGTSWVNPIKAKDYFWHVETYWKQAKLSKLKRTSNDIVFRMFHEKDFDEQFKRSYADELLLAVNEDQRKLRESIAQAYKLSKSYAIILSSRFVVITDNAVKLDELAPMELYSGISNRFDWTEYLHTYVVGCHEFILEDEVDKNHHINYWRQKLFIENNIVEVKSKL